MVTHINMTPTLDLDMRKSSRTPANIFVKVKVLDSESGYDFHAIAADTSSAGLGLHTYLPLPVGTQIAIDLGGDFAALGEVVSVSYDSRQERNKVRLGVHFIEKTENWPFN
ncbi:MAG: PilZ domain-containing protein [Acidobacteriota bacterium]